MQKYKIKLQRYTRENNIKCFSIHSCCSNELSNSFNSCSKSNLESINFTKLLRALQPILASFNQFLFIKIHFSSLSNCKQHLFKLVRILVREKIFFISIWEPIIPNICLIKKPIVDNMVSCFFHHFKGHLISFASSRYF